MAGFGGRDGAARDGVCGHGRGGEGSEAERRRVEERGAGAGGGIDWTYFEASVEDEHLASAPRSFVVSHAWVSHRLWLVYKV